jgi:hypothetical protein
LAFALLTAPAHAVSFSYNNWVSAEGDAALLVRNSPTTYTGAHPPSYLEMTGDADVGQLSIVRWDVYDDAGSNVVYSLGPHEVTDFVRSPRGAWHGSLTTPEGEWSVSFEGDSSITTKWTLYLQPLTEWFVDEIVLTFQPLYRPFKIVQLSEVGDIPEPSTIGLMAASVAIMAIGRRQSRRRVRVR